MKTKMRVLAEMLGVEFGEEFTLEYNEISYRCILTEAGGLSYQDGIGWRMASSDLYRAILFDDVKVFKLYHPSKGDRYYTPWFSLPSKCIESFWSDCEYENWAYEHGLICKTRKEAEILADKLADYAKKLKENK